MHIIRNFQNINKDLQNTVLIIGNFDGIHLGHQTILESAKKIASGENLKSALLTFEPHPLKIVRPNLIFDQKLCSLSQKLFFLKKKDLIDIVFVNNFNKNIANLSAIDFVEKFLIKKLKIKHLVVGYDFIFGKDRLGNANLLQKLATTYNFSFHQIAAKGNVKQEVYSSTKIRKFIKNGDIKLANQMLGRNYQIDGTVIKGKQLARNLGFPTANFLPKKDLIKLKLGVYKVNVVLGNKKYLAVMNFGVKPTFEDIKQPVFEVHIIDFKKDIYGKKIFVDLVDFIREEKKFNSVEELINQITNDKLQLINC